MNLSDEAVEFICGFCGASCIADPAPPDELPCVLHYMPMCEQYEKLEPVDFLTASREEHQRKGTNPTTGALLE
jgi:hypothetical protein